MLRGLTGRQNSIGEESILVFCKCSTGRLLAIESRPEDTSSHASWDVTAVQIDTAPLADWPPM